MKIILCCSVLSVLITCYSGCTRNEVVSEPILPGDPFEVQAWDYSTSHYFVDSTYTRFYEIYYVNEPPVVTVDMQQNQIVDIEVWAEYIGIDPIQIANAIQAIAYVSLPARGNGYSPSLRRGLVTAGNVETGRVIRLHPWEFALRGDGYLGMLSLEGSVLDQRVYAIAYRRANGDQFGEFLRNVPAESLAAGMPIILKMVKPRNLLSNGSNYPVAWRQLVKSIYSLRLYNVERRDFVLDVFRRLPDGRMGQTILGTPLLRVLMLDRFTPDGVPAPEGDGLFDFRPGRTIDPNRGEIIFPWLRPFDGGIKYFFASKGITLDDTITFLFPQIYDTTRTFAQLSPRNKYLIKGRAFHN